MPDPDAAVTRPGSAHRRPALVVDQGPTSEVVVRFQCSWPIVTCWAAWYTAGEPMTYRSIRRRSSAGQDLR